MDIPNNTYVSLGFGKNMFNVDMIAWLAQGDVYKAVDYWSTEKNTPAEDTVQNLPTTFEANQDNTRVTFTTKRKLDTGDADQDYLIRLNEATDMVWAVHWSSGVWKEHTKYGKFQATFSSSLGNTNLSNIAGKISLTTG